MRYCAMHLRLLIPTVVGAATLGLTGCSGGSGSGSNPTPSPSSTDMGTLTMPGTVYQYQLKNVSSGFALGINAQSQSKGASVVQESGSPADSMWHFVPNVYNSDEVNIEN